MRSLVRVLDDVVYGSVWPTKRLTVWKLAIRVVRKVKFSTRGWSCNVKGDGRSG